MATFLFHQTVYGPIHSRRLGSSLGVNLLPENNKWCNYNCIYCECGWNPSGKGLQRSLPSREQIRRDLEEALKQLAREGRCPDVITFAGNGEPTLHPQFAEIIEDTIALRDLYCTGTKVSVLTNATELHRPEIIEALKRVDQNILKLDSGIAETLHRMNQPQKSISPKALAEQFKIFGGTEIIQTMFLKGDAGNGYIDNTTPEELDAWEALVAEVRPSMVMIYTIDRDTPAVNLEKISPEDMEHIADRIRKHGIPVQVSA